MILKGRKFIPMPFWDCISTNGNPIRFRFKNAKRIEVNNISWWFCYAVNNKLKLEIVTPYNRTDSELDIINALITVEFPKWKKAEPNLCHLANYIYINNRLVELEKSVEKYQDFSVKLDELIEKHGPFNI